MSLGALAKMQSRMMHLTPGSGGDSTPESSEGGNTEQEIDAAVRVAQFRPEIRSATGKLEEVLDFFMSELPRVMASQQQQMQELIIPLNDRIDQVNTRLNFVDKRYDNDHNDLPAYFNDVLSGLNQINGLPQEKSVAEQKAAEKADPHREENWMDDDDDDDDEEEEKEPPAPVVLEASLEVEAEAEADTEAKPETEPEPAADPAQSPSSSTRKKTTKKGTSAKTKGKFAAAGVVSSMGKKKGKKRTSIAKAGLKAATPAAEPAAPAAAEAAAVESASIEAASALVPAEAAPADVAAAPAAAATPANAPEAAVAAAAPVDGSPFAQMAAVTPAAPAAAPGAPAEAPAAPAAAAVGADGQPKKSKFAQMAADKRAKEMPDPDAVSDDPIEREQKEHTAQLKGLRKDILVLGTSLQWLKQDMKNRQELQASKDHNQDKAHSMQINRLESVVQELRLGQSGMETRMIGVADQVETRLAAQGLEFGQLMTTTARELQEVQNKRQDEAMQEVENMKEVMQEQHNNLGESLNQLQAQVLEWFASQQWDKKIATIEFELGGVKRLAASNNSEIKKLSGACSKLENGMSKLNNQMSKLKLEQDTLAKEQKIKNREIVKDIKATLKRMDELNEANGTATDMMDRLKERADEQGAKAAAIAALVEKNSLTAASKATALDTVIKEGLKSCKVDTDTTNTRLNDSIEKQTVYKEDIDKAAESIVRLQEKLAQQKEDFDEQLQIVKDYQPAGGGGGGGEMNPEVLAELQNGIQTCKEGTEALEAEMRKQLRKTEKECKLDIETKMLLAQVPELVDEVQAMRPTVAEHTDTIEKSEKQIKETCSKLLEVEAEMKGIDAKQEVTAVRLAEKTTKDEEFEDEIKRDMDSLSNQVKFGAGGGGGGGGGGMSAEEAEAIEGKLEKHDKAIRQKAEVTRLTAFKHELETSLKMLQGTMKDLQNSCDNLEDRVDGACDQQQVKDMVEEGIYVYHSAQQEQDDLNGLAGGTKCISCNSTRVQMTDALPRVIRQMLPAQGGSGMSTSRSGLSTPDFSTTPRSRGTTPRGGGATPRVPAIASAPGILGAGEIKVSAGGRQPATEQWMAFVNNLGQGGGGGSGVGGGGPGRLPQMGRPHTSGGSRSVNQRLAKGSDNGQYFMAT
jgi:hypothetical protein